MTVANYYSLLGLSQQESTVGIAAAHRDFQRNVEHTFGSFWPASRIAAFEHAFSVLDRESARIAYDKMLEMETGPSSCCVVCEPPEISSILAERESVHPSFESLYQRLARNCTGAGIPKGEHCEALTVEIPVTADDLEQQRTVPVGIPTFDICSTCNGTGRVALFRCAACEGQGIIEGLRVIEHVLGRERVMDLPLHDAGIQNCFLRVRIQMAHA